MAENFYSDNPDLGFHLWNVGLDEVVDLREEDFRHAGESPEAPVDLEDALSGYEQVLDMMGELCAEKIAPRAEDVDKEGPVLEDGEVRYASGTEQNLADLAQARVMGVMLPREYGGLNMPCTVYTMMTEMVSRADASLQNLFGLQDIAQTILFFGDDDQRRRYLPRFASGEADGAMALTEPEAGSDLQAVQLKARKDPETGQWKLNGMKRFITNGCAQIHLVLARSEENSKDGRGLSMFVCEKCSELKIRRIEDKLGIHGSPTCELQFNDVPAELVGRRRRGLSRYVMSLMNGARVAISGQAIGIAEAAYREALEYAQAREQFGKAIIRFPAVYEMLAYSKVQIIAARALLYETTKYVDLRDCFEEIVRETPRSELDPEIRKRAKNLTRIAAVLTPLSKAFATEVANKVAYDGIQVHGGTGFMRDFAAERYYRDARITNIYEGTTQLQYVAAIGGIIRGVLEPLIAELRNPGFDPILSECVELLEAGHEKLQESIRYVNESKDSAYHDLMAGRLCRMQTDVFVGYLMLRGATIDGGRQLIARQFISDSMSSISMNHGIICRGDRGLIENHEELLGI